jgi:2'-phosphotransferase
MERPLVKLLRHTALDRGLDVSAEGWVLVDAIRTLKEYKLLSDKQVIQACNDSEKSRLKYVWDNDKLYVKANQGHSKKGVGRVLNDSKALEEIKIEDIDKYPVIVHGSFSKFDKLIEESGGLSIMNRKHIHFAVGLPGDSGVISGMRNKCDRYYYLDLKKSLQDGIKIYISCNNVILTPGDNGILSLKYLKSI